MAACPTEGTAAGELLRLADDMPDPLSLKIGDRVRFTSLPEERSLADYSTPRESICFMKRMLKRTWPSRVAEIGEYGNPWIHARIRVRGKVHHHSWSILESTGWRIVAVRT